uniref:Uncharacterized protein n=1 Tax=Cajanus cajan TaxID=3821 RepID=A0A151QRW3_CAJCA|nr:hypothetical protein KK1_046149 [Cajanus cajan]
MINAGHVYSEIASKTVQDVQSKVNTHRKVQIPCSHVLASCLQAHHDYQTYISPIYTLQQVAKVYKESLESSDMKIIGLLTLVQLCGQIQNSRELLRVDQSPAGLEQRWTLEKNIIV